MLVILVERIKFLMLLFKTTGVNGRTKKQKHSTIMNSVFTICFHFTFITVSIIHCPSDFFGLYAKCNYSSKCQEKNVKACQENPTMYKDCQYLNL